MITVTPNTAYMLVWEPYFSKATQFCICGAPLATKVSEVMGLESQKCAVPEKIDCPKKNLPTRVKKLVKS